MIYLRDFNKFDRIALLDTGSNNITWMLKSENPQLSQMPIQGVIALVEERLVCLYRNGGSLHLRVGDVGVVVTDMVVVNLVSLSELANRFTVVEGAQRLVDWTYARPVIDPPLELDLNPFVEEEHFDILLFIYNVVNSPGRRQRIFRNLE